jgi:diaminopimelate decarboxylase
MAIQTQSFPETPYYVFDEVKFTENINDFRRVLEAKWSKIIIGYSIKTNYIPVICALARDLGCYGEAVSRMELELAARLKFDAGKIIFNGPLKTAHDLLFAISMDAIINLDSLAQVDTFLGLSKDAQAKARIGLRLNVDLSASLNTTGKIAAGGKVPRFGLPRKDADEAVMRLRAAGVSVQSLHGHANSSDRKPENYGKIAGLLLETAERHNLDELKFLDIGGGYSGSLPEIWEVESSPGFGDYAEAIFGPLLGSAWFQRVAPAVVIEPGMSVVADCMNYVTAVVARKEVQDRSLLGVDGNFFDIRPTLHQKPLPFILHSATPAGYGSKRRYTVTGSTCMERDILLDEMLFDREVQVGDLIEITHVGAYTIVLSPHFINYACAAYLRSGDGKMRVLRRAQQFDDFFACYSFE